MIIIMEQIPCISNKCILYPVCVSKIDIECDDLWKYFRHVDVTNKTQATVWEIMRRDFPVLNLVYPTTYQRP